MVGSMEVRSTAMTGWRCLGFSGVGAPEDIPSLERIAGRENPEGEYAIVVTVPHVASVSYG